jgi:formimidoylglutamate deiminase
MPGEARRFHAPLAWVRGSWARDVLLEVDGAGCWSRVETEVNEAARIGNAVSLAGPVLPGIVDAHSHAFQRAIAGLTERSPGGDDDFWSWRDRMYRAANRISPEQLEAVAAFLYAELLRAGYTQVCEFHYLHNDTGGKPYADARELSLALVRAAQRVGIGLTLLPTLYMRSGFAAKGLREDQLRFASTPGSVLDIAGAVRASTGGNGRVTAGVAIHSLRAADLAAIRETAQEAREMGGLPAHIHISEQRREVEDCQAEHGKTPIEFLLSEVPVDAGWNLVHATQANPAELSALRQTGAAIVICPSTEANLGDGIFDFASWAGESGVWSVGSDSHVTRSWREELRLLEYSQRLHLRKRNVAAHASVAASSATALFQQALEGGSTAAGLPLGGIAVGQRADFSVVDANSPELAGLPDDHTLDALVFSTPESMFSRVFVGGDEVLQQGQADELARGFRDAMKALWGS